jgi:hypothetical protein
MKDKNNGIVRLVEIPYIHTTSSSQRAFKFQGLFIVQNKEKKDKYRLSPRNGKAVV